MSDEIKVEEELFDPSKWTQKELLKHLYRKQIEYEEKIEAIQTKQSKEFAKINEHLTNLEADYNQRKGFYAAAAIAAGIIGTLLTRLAQFIIE